MLGFDIYQKKNEAFVWFISPGFGQDDLYYSGFYYWLICKSAVTFPHFKYKIIDLGKTWQMFSHKMILYLNFFPICFQHELKRLEKWKWGWQQSLSLSLQCFIFLTFHWKHSTGFLICLPCPHVCIAPFQRKLPNTVLKVIYLKMIRASIQAIAY